MATKIEREKIREEHANSWIPVEAGDTIMGKVVDVTEAWSDQRQKGSWYPLLRLTAEDATGYNLAQRSPEFKVHCFGTVLFNEVMRHRPEVGERVRITYRGQGKAKSKGNPPELYTVRVEGRTDQAERAYSRIEGGPARPGSGAIDTAAHPPATPAGEHTSIEDETDIPF